MNQINNFTLHVTPATAGAYTRSLSGLCTSVSSQFSTTVRMGPGLRRGDGGAFA